MSTRDGSNSRPEPRQEAERIVEELGRNSYEHALHNYDGLTLDADHSHRRQELRRRAVDVLAAAIEVRQAHKGGYADCDCVECEELDRALSALREGS